MQMENHEPTITEGQRNTVTLNSHKALDGRTPAKVRPINPIAFKPSKHFENKESLIYAICKQAFYNPPDKFDKAVMRGT